MKTIREGLLPQDVPIVSAMYEGARTRRGKIFAPRDRDAFDARKSGVQAAAGVTTEPGSVGGVPGWWCRPSEGRSDARILYLHGGGYVVGSAKAFRNPASHFAHLASVETFIPDYRLAPENPFPAAIDDVVAAYRGLLQDGVQKIAVVGDSAGGGLAVSLLVSAALEGSSRIRGAVLLSPLVDLSFSGASMRTRAEADPVFTKDVLAALACNYLQGHDDTDPKASPLFGPLAGLPPLRIDVGENEVMLDDATRLAAAVTAAGGEVTLSIWEGMAHSFHNGVGRLAAANRALVEEGRFLADRLK